MVEPLAQGFGQWFSFVAGFLYKDRYLVFTHFPLWKWPQTCHRSSTAQAVSWCTSLHTAVQRGGHLLWFQSRAICVPSHSSLSCQCRPQRPLVLYGSQTVWYAPTLIKKSGSFETKKQHHTKGVWTFSSRESSSAISTIFKCPLLRPQLLCLLAAVLWAPCPCCWSCWRSCSTYGRCHSILYRAAHSPPIVWGQWPGSEAGCGFQSGADAGHALGTEQVCAGEYILTVHGWCHTSAQCIYLELM